MHAAPGRLVVISGPSGSGKTTVLRELFGRCPWLEASVSATTRSPRPGERDGVDYYFLTPETFAAKRAANEFLEAFEVFGRGHWYGTLQSEVAPRLAAGKWVVLEIDVDGAADVLRTYPDAITVFIKPESLEELERRLRSRHRNRGRGPTAIGSRATRIASDRAVPPRAGQRIDRAGRRRPQPVVATLAFRTDDGRRGLVIRPPRHATKRSRHVNLFEEVHDRCPEGRSDRQ
ncbi:MAG: guanylate kinase [Pirellulales bacterium]